MQKDLIIFLCVLVTLVLIEAKPWCSNFGCNDKSSFIFGGDGGYIDTDEGGSGEGEILDGGYIDGYRGNDRRSNRNRYNRRGRFGVGGYRSAGYGNSGYGGSGRSGGDYGDNGYGGSERGNDGYSGNIYGSGGYSGNRYGSGGYGGGRYGSGGYGGGGHGGRRRPPYSDNNGSDDRNYSYLVRECYNCTIKSYGNGEGNSNTFNLPREEYTRG